MHVLSFVAAVVAVLCLNVAEGKVVLITGASSGIGLQVAKDLAALGHEVFLTARREPQLKTVVASITSAGGKAGYATMDVTSEASQVAAFAAADKLFGGIDFVLSNAGVEGAGFGTAKLESDVFDGASLKVLFDINVVGSMITAKHALIAFHKRGGGGIAFSSSIAAALNQNTLGALSAMGHPAPTSLLAYSASKAAVDQLARGLAGVYENINVWTLNICAFDSEMTQRNDAVQNRPDSLAGFNPYFKTAHGKPDAISKVVAALVDGTSGWKNGAGIFIDHDATFDSKHYTDLYYSPKPVQQLGVLTPDELKPHMMNAQGTAPYDFGKQEL